MAEERVQRAAKNKKDSGIGDYYGLGVNPPSAPHTPFGSIADNTFTVDGQSYTLTEFYLENNAPPSDVWFTLTDADGDAINPLDTFYNYYFEISGSTGDTVQINPLSSTYASGRTTIPYTFTLQQLRDIGVMDSNNVLQSTFTFSVRLYISTTLGEPNAITGGETSIDVSLDEGVHKVFGIQTDGDGNISRQSQPLTITLDATAPVITVPTETVTNFNTDQEYSPPTPTVLDPRNSDYSGEVVITITDSDGDTVSAEDVTEEVGVYTVTYTAPADTSGNTPEPVIRTITVALPAEDDTASTDEDISVVIDVLANDTGLSAGTLAVSTQPSNGVAVVSSNTEISYTPNENFNGSDSFTYSYTTADGVYTATVNLTITPVNDAPTLSASATTTHTITTTKEIDLSTHFTDVEGDTLTFSVSNSDDSKALSSITLSTLTVTPLSDGTATLTLTVNDGTTSITQEYSITVNLPITVSSEITPTGISKTKTLTLTFSHTPTITYKRFESEATGTCDETGYASNSGTEETYTTPLQFTSENDNGDSICFKLTQTGKDTIYHSAQISNIDTTAPTLSNLSNIGDNT